MNKIEIGDATLYQGDCLEIMAILDPVDAVITDPPYGVNVDYGLFVDSQENVIALAKKWVPLARGIANRVIFTSGTKNLFHYPKPDWIMAWITPAGTGVGPWGFCCWQPILCYGADPILKSGRGSRPDIIQHTESSEKNGHPCPKPKKFMRRLVERVSLKHEIILDPFMGSGMTGVACVKLGRKFIGIEIESKYFDIACKQIEDAYRQGDMFLERPKQLEQSKMEFGS